ncbi:LOW QUALITY PROTEIN: uncharacterized protein LOC133835834 [Drosophila sulfurigaster albostrigata]|uniref:LOW QUALITY PROTEIN: uncharacterized protein LOC133835834 n=1 Tax=Drosophila sulfurigaster albostrigata TaxID=89887 RepID=UPI002D21CC43|nr:LOW QUALITY PROTEIN: uncharacterized protein LOC133835834 [Drosophila sulfurigaster albostrigata]
MEFPQQIEETLVLAQQTTYAYDVVMESPLYPKVNNNLSSKVSPSGDKMNSSMNSSSTLEDTTPSDSGVQMLDSENSDVMIESITSQTGLEYEEPLKATAIVAEQQQQQPTVDTNSNVPATEETMTTSAYSTFDTTEKIVYRRKVHKTTSTPKAPKKRVSFHEDILKNTRTDNIHIEHGFITYKNGRKLAVVGGNSAGVAGAAGRYSWCAERERIHGPTELSAAGRDSEETGGGEVVGRSRRLVYRNACSDVLDYGNTDIYDTNDPVGLQYDNSGVFEYASTTAEGKQRDERLLYRCACSSSNSSLDSDEQDKNSNSNANRKQYEQAKSSSCDCIGMSNANNNLIGENCYYSEPNIGDAGSPKQKSVWNKEKKPKSSCLKKTKRHTNIIQEQDLSDRVKKFNVHDIKHQLLDNSSKMIFGSLKSIFTMPLPERGVPEGSEDLQSVVECVPELEQTPEHKPTHQQKLQYQSPDSPPLKAKPFLSKSLDGNKQAQGVKKFVHNVDEQLRRKNDDHSASSSTEASPMDSSKQHVLRRQDEFDKETAAGAVSIVTSTQSEFRSKFIINCESTVFEHTGVSYETSESNQLEPSISTTQHSSVASLLERDTPIAQPASQLRSSFMAAPIAKTFSNFFRSFTDSSANNAEAEKEKEQKEQQQQQAATDSYFASKMSKTARPQQAQAIPNKLPTTHSSSTISELSSISNNTNSNSNSCSKPPSQSQINANPLMLGSVERQSRHLPSPLKKRGQPLQPPRYGDQQHHSRSLHSPSSYLGARGGCPGPGAPGGSGRDSKSTILSEEFDDILTITTTTDTANDRPSTESDLVIVDYTDVDYAELLKPPTPAAKTSLINRFLRNVTQKKILESSIRKNDFFADKLRGEQKHVGSHLYVRGVRPKNYELIDDLNAEIAMEIEMSGANSPRRELAVGMDLDLPGDLSRFELGIGEISIDIFSGKHLSIFREPDEQLLKVFKLYTGYSCEGYMTPVLVLLTDKTLYVSDLVRNCLCAKFVLAYKDLDVILMGPFGNTVLLSNSMRDMQQVLLAGGPYPADALVANLELCARRSGSTLPAVGQLTLEHLAPLQAFVRANSCVGKDENWIFYAVVNMPAGGVLGMGLVDEQEPLGPHIKGFLMHRRVRESTSSAAASKINWQPGYFLLKAGVLYMFNDSTQKLPSWAMALAECQGARRAVKSARPHCFEIMLKGQLLQMAAPDEYVASEWLQALLQSASGLFELQEKHKALGCTLIVTQNHLITLREDFSAPLRQLTKQMESPTAAAPEPKPPIRDDEMLCIFDTSSVLSSTTSTPTRGTQRSCSSLNSTPTKQSQDVAKATEKSASEVGQSQKMRSVYGKNSGLEILTCADIKAMTGIKIPSHSETWWCILEFSCQEAPVECMDDLVIFFASNMEMQRFLRLLEQLWQAKNNDLFPITILDDDDTLAEQCTMLYLDINRAWEPLLSAALGYPL